MEIDFDKEIDSLLRRASRRGERASFETSAQEEIHLDADELSAFAENSLPAATRSAFAAHLVDCARCRKIATSITTPTPFAESSSEESAREAIAEDSSLPVTRMPEIKKTPGWRERLSAIFAPPVLIYGVPALVLLFVGIAAFVALRTDRSDEQLTVARREEPTIERMVETNDNSNMATANPSGTNGASSNANMSGMSTANANTMNSNMGAIESNAGNISSGTNGAATTEGRAGNATPDFAPPPPPPAIAPQTFGTPTQSRASDSLSNQTTDDSIAARTGSAQPNARTRNMNAGPMPQQQQAAPIGGREARDESERVAVAPSSPPVSESATTRRSRNTPSRRATAGRGQADSENDERADTDAPTRAVAGRTFRRQGGAWVDTAYRAGAATVNVTRGSEQFRALAADEPVIGRVAAQLGGEVIVVVRGRAYRIR